MRSFILLYSSYEVIIFMKHYMRLNEGPFNLIKCGSKTIELRLNDEKRQLIKKGDVIEFENRITLEKLKVVVLNLHKYNNFFELYSNFDKISMGYAEDEEANPSDMELYYSREEQEKYGVVGIEIKSYVEEIYDYIRSDS